MKYLGAFLVLLSGFSLVLGMAFRDYEFYLIAIVCSVNAIYFQQLSWDDNEENTSYEEKDVK